MENEPYLPIRTGAADHEDFRGATAPYRWTGSRRSAEEEDIDWRRWIQVFWRRRWWILAATALGTLSAVVSVRNQEPRYQARAILWIDEAQDQVWPVVSGRGLSPAGLAVVLRSGAVLEGVVEKLRLYIRPDDPRHWSLFDELQVTDNTVSGHYTLQRIAGGRFSLVDGTGQEVQRVEPGDTIGQPLGFQWVLPEDQLRSLTGNIGFSVSRPGHATGLISGGLGVESGAKRGDLNIMHVSYIADDRRFATTVLNATIEEFIRVTGELKRQEQASLVRTLERQIGAWADSLRLAESRLQRFRIRTATLPGEPAEQVVLPSGEGASVRRATFADPVFDRYYALISDRDALTQDLQGLRNVLRELEANGTLNVMRLEAIPSTVTASLLASALNDYRQTESDYRTLLQTYTPEHREVRRAAERLAELAQSTIPRVAEQLIQRLETRIGQLDREIASQEGELQQMPPRTMEENRLTRDFQLAEQVFTSLQTAHKEAQVAEGATEPNIRVLNPPSASSTGTRGYSMVVIAFALSLALGLGSVILWDRFFERRIQFPGQIEEDLGLPVLAVVPNVRALQPGRGRRNGAATSEVAWTTIESFRALRTQLLQGTKIEFPTVLAVTSPAPEDGKTMVSANLAMAFASGPNRSTVLIDGDMRRGRLNSTFNLSSSPGLSDYLRGEAELDDVLMETDVEGLSLIPRGRAAEEAPELLDGDRLSGLLEQLRKRFKVIILDTPPLTAGVDGLLIGARSDGVIAVLRANRTDLDLARAMFTSYARALGVPIIGAVLNDVRAEGPYQYYRGLSYGYYPTEPQDV